MVARGGGGNPLALAQAHVYRALGGFHIVWIPGGPLSLSGSKLSSDLIESLHQDLEAAVGPCYLRCNFMDPVDGAHSYDLARYMNRPVVRMLSGYTILLDLDIDENIWLTSMDSKHRYYIRHSRKNNIVWRYGNDDSNLRSLSGLTEALVQEKGLNFDVYDFSRLTQLRHHLADSVKVIVGYSNDEPITGAMVLTQSGRGHYCTAATSGKGRELSAAYAMVAELRGHLRHEGIKMLDFGGIAPRDKTRRGVDHFKLGFGGRVVEYLGEWEAGNRFSRLLVNLGVRIKRGSMGGSV
ncbi:MAG: peptidoglycan bridge formation glycyltransferase FemA/FemB family protein [Syntrophorhabdaceae bacterium]